jgi:hypothetical protein
MDVELGGAAPGGGTERRGAAPGGGGAHAAGAARPHCKGSFSWAPRRAVRAPQRRTARIALRSRACADTRAALRCVAQAGVTAVDSGDSDNGGKSGGGCDPNDPKGVERASDSAAAPSRGMRALKAAMVLVLLASAGVGGGIAYKLGAACGCSFAARDRCHGGRVANPLWSLRRFVAPLRAGHASEVRAFRLQFEASVEELHAVMQRSLDRVVRRRGACRARGTASQQANNLPSVSASRKPQSPPPLRRPRAAEERGHVRALRGGLA